MDDHFSDPGGEQRHPDDPTENRLVTLRRCQSAAEASLIAARLETAGLEAFVQGSEVTTMLSYIGTAIQTARVEVAQRDVDRAEAVLRQDALDACIKTAWQCSRCDQHNEPAFEMCWSCSKSRSDSDPASGSDEDDRDAARFAPAIADPDEPIGGHDDTPAVRLSADDKINPFAVTTIDEGSDAASKKIRPITPAVTPDDEKNPALQRAFRSAVIGFFVLPPLLHFYSLYLLFAHVGPPDRRRLGGLTKYAVTLGLNALGILFGLAIPFYWFSLPTL